MRLVPAGCGFCGLRAGHLHCRESLPTIELTQNTFSSSASMHFCILRPAVNKILIGVLFASIDSLLYLRGCEGPCKHCLGILMWRLFRKKIVNFPFSPTRGQHIPTSIQVSEKVYLANISSAKHCWIMLKMMMMEVIMVMMMGINGKAVPASHSSTKRSFSGKKLITNTFRGDHHYTLASQKSI